MPTAERTPAFLSPSQTEIANPFSHSGRLTILFPPGYAKISMPPVESLPEPLRLEVARQRATAAGRLVLRLYAEERTKKHP